MERGRWVQCSSVHRAALLVSTAIGAALFASSALASHDAPKQSGSCGGPGQPPCPMQAFMRTSIAAPLASNNSGALAMGLEKVARSVPDPSWTSWGAIASQGAAAAKRGDITGARAACKGCHDAWRAAYKSTYRMRPVPP